MKLYIFTLDHLSTVQKGIQAAHAVAELMNDDLHPKWDEIVLDWATNHKTIIMLQGGNYTRLAELHDNALAAEQTVFPAAAFREDIDTLGGLLTTVAVLCPFDLPIDISKFAAMPLASQEVFKMLSGKKVTQ